MEKVKIIIVDDHLMIRSGLALLLNSIENYKVLGGASNGIEFLEMLDNYDPDLVFMDINMPKMNGVEATKEALKKKPDMKIVALSMNEDESSLDDMLQAGVKGFLLKKAGTDELQKAIEVVLNDGNYFSQELMKFLTRKIIPSKTNNQVLFNAREKEVLKYLCMGLSTQEIADKIFVSVRTVEAYRASLLEKTNTKNSIGVVLYAIKNKLVNID